ncbi:Ubiquitin domain-containing protein DSK2a [Bienertia sinuspersici]
MIFCSTPSCPKKIGPFPTFELLTPSPTAVSAYSVTSTLDAGAIVTEEILAKDISVTDNAIVSDHSKHVDEGFSVSSPKDGQLIVAHAGATSSIPEAVGGDQTNKKETDDDVPSEKSSEHTPSPQAFGVTGDFGQSLPIVTPLNVQRPHDDGYYSSIDRSARIPDVAIPEYIRQNTLEKVKEYIDLVEEETDVDDSNLECLISDIEKSIENCSSTDEEIKKEFGEEVGKNVAEDVRTTKMQRVSFHKEEEEIPDSKNDDCFAGETEVSKKGKTESSETIDSYNDLPVTNCDIIVSRTLKLQRNKYLAELSDQEQLRHTLESLVLLDIINPANPDIHVCMTKTDFLSWAPKTWLTGASIDACSYVFNRREEEKPGNPRRFWFNILPFNYINWLIDERKKKEKIESIIAKREIDLEKAKDNPCYDTMKAEWLKDKKKMTYRDSTFFTDKCRQSMSEWEKMLPNNTMEWYDGGNEKKHPITTLLPAYTKNLTRCHLAIDLVSYKENRRKQEVLKDCALWSTTKPFLIQQQKKRKDKEKHLANLRAKRVEKVFLEDEKIKKERARHEQEVDDFLNNDLDDSPKYKKLF